ncbi:MAG: FtsX-like permease family protein, partial [Sphaerochaetaceae bacterium]|nr:FtsX-like permease family protein [Sphaerochaetaceae bacterium]
INRSQSVVSTIAKEFPEATIRPWQQVNSAFYSALTLEKVMMYLFLLFMFIILAVNMKNASSRLLFVKQRELAILRALGSPKHITVQVFLLQAVIITLIGETIGIIGSFLLGTYISPILTWIDSIQSKFSGKSNVLLSYPFTMEIQTGEVIVITCIVLALSVGFTYIGCRHLLRKEPMELMYHE